MDDDDIEKSLVTTRRVSRVVQKLTLRVARGKPIERAYPSSRSNIYIDLYVLYEIPPTSNLVINSLINK